MSWEKGFDNLLDDVLTSLRNQNPDLDLSEGTLIFMKSVALASALWGAYKYQDYLGRQIHPDLAETANLEHYASNRGLTRSSGETDDQLLTRLLSVMRNPPAGGNKYDWPRWAKEASYVHDTGLVTEWTEQAKTAAIYEHARGQGTINVAITSTRTAAQGGEEEPTSDLLDAITDYINEKRPVGIWDFIIYEESKLTTDVTMTVTGATDTEKQNIEDEIESYMKSLFGSKTLFTAKLISIAIDNGADVVPSSGPTSYQRVWPGTITIS